MIAARTAPQLVRGTCGACCLLRLRASTRGRSGRFCPPQSLPDPAPGITARAGWMGGQPLAIHLASRAPLREGAWHGAALHAHGGYLGIGPRPGGAGGPDSKQGDVPGQLHCEREGCQGCMAEATCGWSVREATPLHRAHAARSPLGCSGRSSASTRDDTLCSRVCGWRFDCGFETLRS